MTTSTDLIKTLDQQVDELGLNQANLFALLDGAWQPQAASIVRNGDEPWLPLLGFDKEDKAESNELSPLLVETSLKSPSYVAMLDTGFSDKLGITLVSDESLADLKRHLKKFTLYTLCCIR